MLLADALADLRASVGLFRRELEGLSAGGTPAFSGLRSVIASLGADKAIAAPASASVEECIRSWRSGKPLDRRAVRLLCWEPSLALEPRFHSAIDQQRIALDARALQGLVRSCHMKWTAYLADDSMQRIILRALKSYQGANRTVRRWQENARLILAPSAPANLSLWMLEQNKPLDETASFGRLDQSTEFFATTVNAVITNGRREWASNAVSRDYLLRFALPWPGWPVGDLRRAVGECILDVDAKRPEIQGPLTDLILRDRRLGDPRLPVNRVNWLANTDARRRLIEWLSRADIVFFFDHAFPKKRRQAPEEALLAAVRFKSCDVAPSSESGRQSSSAKS